MLPYYIGFANRLYLTLFCAIYTISGALENIIFRAFASGLVLEKVMNSGMGSLSRLENCLENVLSTLPIFIDQERQVVKHSNQY